MGATAVTPNVDASQAAYWSEIPPPKTAGTPSPDKTGYWSLDKPAAPAKTAAAASTPPVSSPPAPDHGDDEDEYGSPARENSAITSPAAPPAAKPLTDNSSGEGVYAMQDGKGATVQVPYSKVEDAKQQGYQLTGGTKWTGAPDGDAARYLRDHMADPGVRKSYADMLDDTVEARVSRLVTDPVRRIGGGLKDVVTAAPDDGGMTIEHGIRINQTRTPTPEEVDAGNRKALHGMAQILAGGGELGLIIGAPELTALAGAAAGGDAAAIAALARIGVSVGVGTAASAGAGKVADTLKLSPEAKELAQQASFWAGAGLTGYAAKVEPVEGHYGAKGVRASTRGGGASVEVGRRPAYRQPSPAGSYDEGSTVVPARTYVRGSVGGKRFGSGPEVASAEAAPPSAAAEPPEAKGLPAPQAVVSPQDEAYWSAEPTRGGPEAATEPPADEKPVLHTSNRIDALQASAERQSGDLGNAVAAAAKGVPGAEVDAVRASKDEDRIADKAERQGVEPNQIGDVAAAKVIVPDQKAADAVLANLHHQMPVESMAGSVVGEPGKNGVRQAQALVNTGAGPDEPVKRAEVLIQTPEMAAATDTTHDDYRQAQELRAVGKVGKAEELEAKIEAVHDEAAAEAATRINEDRAETKYKHGNTQANIPADSEAHAALLAAAKKIDPADLNPTSYGGDESGLEPDPHVTVRYGIRGEDTSGIEKYLRAQAPFEATLGKTSAFPPSQSSDGGAVIKAEAELPAPADKSPGMAKGELVSLPDGSSGTVQWSVGGKVRVKTADGSRLDIAAKHAALLRSPVAEIEPGDSPRAKEIAARVEAGGPAIVSQYLRANSPHGVPYISPDAAKSLIPEYVADPTGANQDVGPAAGAITHAAWDSVIATKPLPDKDYALITMGSPASGKTTGILSQEQGARIGITRETIPRTAAALSKTIDETLASGRRPLIMLVYTSDPKTNMERAIDRAHSIGRAVPIDYMASAYVNQPKIAQAILDKYGDRVDVVTVDNSGKAGDEKVYNGTVAPALDATGSFTVETAKEASLEVLERLRQEGRVPDAIYRAFLGSGAGATPVPAPAESDAGGEGDRTEVRSEPGGRSEGRQDLQLSEPPQKPENDLAQKREAFKATKARPDLELQPGKSAEVPVYALVLDPKRFQYKVSNIGAGGVSHLLAGNKWNPDLAGVVSVWRDPANGRMYVVNGHHRVDLAKRSGVKTMLVRMLAVQTAQEARARGALQNIADGRGTAIDAAKFFRDSGITVADLDAEGVSMGEATAQNGVALSRLAEPIFHAVVQGRMSQGRGIAIGRETADAATQDAIVKLVDKAEKRGVKVTDGTVEELARFASTAPQREETTASLFGDQTRVESTALDKAAVSAYVLREFRTDKRTFGAVASESRAVRLAAEGKNQIDVAGNAEKAKGAEQATEVYLRLSARRGPIDDILNRAAEERASAKPAEIAGIDRRAYDEIRARISETLSGGEEPGVDRVQEDSGRRDGDEETRLGQAELEAAGQGDFFSLKPLDPPERTPAPPEAALPGMEGDIARQRDSAASVKAEGERNTAEASLATPQADVSRASGDVERNSPLFRDAEANPQGGLFGGDSADRDPDGSTKLYANPFDPELFRKYIGEPLMRMAEPLREEFGRRSDIAAVANNVHDTLQRLDRANKAVTLEAKGIARAFEEAGFGKVDGDKVFAHLEDPSVKLNPEQVQLRDKWIKPLDQRAALQRRIALLIKSGKFALEDILRGRVPAEDVQRIAPEQANYQHRIPVDKNTFVDKILGDSMKRFRGPGAALSRAFSSGKRSVFHEVTGPNGEREAVALKNGRVAQFRMGADGRPVVTDMGPYRSGFVDTETMAKEVAKPLETKLDALRKEYAILTGTKGRIAASGQRIANIEREVASLEKQIAAIHQSIEGKPNGMSDSEAMAARLAPIQKVIERLLSQKQGLLPTSDNAKRIAHLTQRIQENERLMEDIRDQHEGPELQGRYWRDKDGGLRKFGRGTTRFISERTGQKYHANAMLSSLVNFIETSKAMNAAVVMERTKGLLEANGMAMQSDDPARVPDGWKPTTLLQMHGYYFPAHVADSLDQFDYLQSRGQPNVLERANRFVISSVLINPLMHGKNIAANWFTGKAAEAITGHAFTPPWYSRNMQAGIKAVNTLRDLGGEEYRRLMRLGLDLQGASTNFDQTTKDILRSFTDALDKDKESNLAISALLGVGNAAKWLQHMNHLATFGINDLFVMQSYYAAEAKFRAEGVPNPEEAARDWSHSQVVEYTTPVRAAGSAPVARLLENPNISAFWRYHFGGIVRPMVNSVKEAAGSFTPDEEASAAAGGEERNEYGQSRAAARTNAIGRLAVMTLFATVVLPKLLDRLAKKITGDAQAKAPRGGVLGAASNLAESVEGDRDWSSTIGSVVTPALGSEELAEIGLNRDFFTGKHVMGTNVGFEEKAKQLAAWLVSKSTPGQIMHRTDQGAGRRALYGLLGFTFPLEHGLKEAAEIRNEAEGSNPADARTVKVWQSIMAAAEQARRTGGKDTSVKDALLHSRVLTSAQRRQLMMAVHETPIVFAAADLEHDEDVWRVFQHSTDEEKRELVEDPRTRRRLNKYVVKLRAGGESNKADLIAAELTRRQ